MFAACSSAVMRIVPAGFSRSSLNAASSASISSSLDPSVRAGLGRLNTPRGSGEQAQPEAGFQIPDGLAERGLRYPQLRRRFGEAMLPDHRQESRQIVQVRVRHSLACLISPFGQYGLIAGEESNYLWSGKVGGLISPHAVKPDNRAEGGPI